MATSGKTKYAINVLTAGFHAALRKHRPLFRSGLKAMDTEYQRGIMRNVAGLFFQAGFIAGVHHAQNAEDKREVKLREWKARV